MRLEIQKLNIRMKWWLRCHFSSMNKIKNDNLKDIRKWPKRLDKVTGEERTSSEKKRTDRYKNVANIHRADPSFYKAYTYAYN